MATLLFYHSSLAKWQWTSLKNSKHTCTFGGWLHGDGQFLSSCFLLWDPKHYSKLLLQHHAIYLNNLGGAKGEQSHRYSCPLLQTNSFTSRKAVVWQHKPHTNTHTCRHHKKEPQASLGRKPHSYYFKHLTALYLRLGRKGREQKITFQQRKRKK